jgi:hypothetical protein
MTEKKMIRFGLLLLLLALLLWWLGPMLIAVMQSSQKLAVRWEGVVIDYNFRDVGASMNACLQKKQFTEGQVFRSSGWFSGWSCAKVGNPEVIYSFNYEPSSGQHFFCMDGGVPLVGKAFNTHDELVDIEFVDSWKSQAFRDDVCGYFADSFTQIAENHRVLIHCDAGRDRTGAYAALLLALSAEGRGLLDESMLDAIECDYRKSPSLAPAKYGRMRRFLVQLIKDGGVAHFFEKQCGISPLLLMQVQERMAQQSGL